MSGYLPPNIPGEHAEHAISARAHGRYNRTKAFEVDSRTNCMHVFMKLLFFFNETSVFQQFALFFFAICSSLYFLQSAYLYIFLQSTYLYIEFSSFCLQYRPAILIWFTICFKHVQIQTPGMRFVPWLLSCELSKNRLKFGACEDSSSPTNLHIDQFYFHSRMATLPWFYRPAMGTIM